MLTIRYDLEEIKGFDKGIGIPKRDARVILSRAMNRGIIKFRKALIKRIQRKYTLKAMTLKAKMQLDKANPDKLIASLYSVGPPGIGLINYYVKRNSIPSTYWIGTEGGKEARPLVGVKVKIRKDKPAKKISDAFAARMLSGHEMIARENPDHEMLVKNKPQIDELFGPSPVQIIETVGNYEFDDIEMDIYLFVEKVINHGIDRYWASH